LPSLSALRRVVAALLVLHLAEVARGVLVSTRSVGVVVAHAPGVGVVAGVVLELAGFVVDLRCVVDGALEIRRARVPRHVGQLAADVVEQAVDRVDQLAALAVISASRGGDDVHGDGGGRDQRDERRAMTTEAWWQRHEDSSR